MKLKYFENYNFEYNKNKINLLDKNKNEKFKYLSKISLYNLSKKTEKDYFLFHFFEDKRRIYIDKKKVSDDILLVSDLFSSLVLYIDKNEKVCVCLNIENLKYRLNLIEKMIEKNFLIQKNIDKYKKILSNEENFLFYINNMRVIKFLFFNSYERNEKSVLNSKKINLDSFIENLVFPIRLNEINLKDEIKIIGEIELLNLNKEKILKKLNLIYKENFNDFEFKYELKIKFDNKRIEKIFLTHNLIIDKKIEIFENYKIKVIKKLDLDSIKYLEILKYLEQIKKKKKINKAKLEEILKEIPFNLRIEVLNEIEKYIDKNNIKILKFSTGEMMTNEHILEFFEENLNKEEETLEENTKIKPEQIVQNEEQEVLTLQEQQQLQKEKERQERIKNTFDEIRPWLLDLLDQKDKVVFPKKEFLEKTKDFNESEKERTLRVIQHFHLNKKYKLKDEFGNIIEGFDVIKEFGNILGIDVEENQEEKETKKEKFDEDENLTPGQLRKKYFLKRMKKEEKK